MLDRILNTDYYRLLVQIFSKNVEFNSSLLPISNFNKTNLSFIKKSINKVNGFDIIIKIPKCPDNLLGELFANIYLFIANYQFYENYINPDFSIGELMVRKVGKRNRKYIIIATTDQRDHNGRVY